MKKSGGRKRRGPRRSAAEEGNDVPVMQVTKTWGNNSSLYYGDGDSGSGSDEDDLIHEALEEEHKHYASVPASSFKVFSNIKRINKPLEMIDSLEGKKEIDYARMHDLRKTVTAVVRDVSDASRELRREFGNSQAEQARKQLLFSLVTNGCFYLHLVGSGTTDTEHDALRHIEKIKALLGVDQTEIIPEAEEDEYEMEEETAEVTETKHIPNQLKTVPEGDYRPVTRSILTGKIMPPSKAGKKKNSRIRGRTNYRRAMHTYNKINKKRDVPTDGVFRGHLGGISQSGSKSVKLHPAH